VSFTVPGYIVYERLGTGARSTIWLVADRRTGEQFALKRVLKRATDDNRFINQALKDFEISVQLDHPNLRHSYELRRIRKFFRLKELHILMEYVDGRTLEEVDLQNISEMISIFRMVAQGLDALHQIGYVHTDIKPNNIMLDDDDRVKIIDFGQSCEIGHIKGRIQGTPDYIAPEQAERGTPMTPRTDVFNLGATLYWAITGKTYPTVIQSKKRANGIDLAGPREAPPPHELRPDIPPALSRLVMDCCKESPKDRPADMREVVKRLEVVQHIIEKDDPNSLGSYTRKGKRSRNNVSTSGDSAA